MFGYVKVDRATLLGKEYEAYKGVYCALCRQLGKDYSLPARMILSYDCTFYALVMLSLAEEPPSYCQGRCCVNPLKKCNYAETKSKALSPAAALSVSAAYFKLIDNIYDSPWYKRIIYRLVQPIFSHWRKKARRICPAVDGTVEKMFNAQLIAENSQDSGIDACAEPTARMLSEVFALIPDEIQLNMSDNVKSKRILGVFGYFLGRWIYLIDAADDYEKDKKSHNFNPFVNSVSPDKNIGEAVFPVLNHALSEALLSYGLLDKGCFDPIIQNVLMVSCVNIQKKVIEKYTVNKNGDNNEESI